MHPVGPLPRLVFGAGALASLGDELALLGVTRPLLLSDRGLERAGAVAAAMRVLTDTATAHVDVPENPTAAGVDEALSAYREGRCDGVVALGGGSVIDAAKILAALAGGGFSRAMDLVGHAERIGPGMAPLIVIPTTVGTGSDSSHVASIHPVAGGPAIGTRHPAMVARVAICDPDLARTLPPRLVAATGIDALSHCLEGFFAEPANALIDAMALDGLSRAHAALPASITPEGDGARGELMLAAFAGGAAIHKGLGPAHAVAIACGDQHVHHGTLIAAALPLTVALVARHTPVKANRAAAALGLASGEHIAPALRVLTRALGLPATYRAAGYVAGPQDRLVDAMAASHFNRHTPYVPTRDEYAEILRELLD